ncbi:MAG: 50S ribosomal protein L21 [Eubacteriales bacterium]|nr:50S ribosomal protein L21 [Eubacteriales bacterium]
MYAIIMTGGKQYKVSEGDIISVEKLGLELGEKVVFDQVVAVSNGDALTIGEPVVNGASVEATVIENFKGKKIRIFKYKPKKGYRKRQGHRQALTKVVIGKING